MTERGPTGGRQPLSFPQERLFLLDRLMPGQAAYNVPTLVRVRAHIDERRLAEGLQRIVDRHEILRTRIELVDGEPVQEAFSPAPVELAVRDLRSLPPSERREQADAFLADFAARPFNLSGDVLLRVALAHVDAEEDLLLVVFHHAASDHVSSAILFRELDEVYAAIGRGEEPELPELPIQYADFARRQRQRLDGPQLQELLAYWRGQLEGAPARLELPSDRPRQSVQSYRGRRGEHTIGPELAESLRALARRQGVSMFMLLLAAFETLLHRYTGAEDLVVGVPVSGRHHQETANLLGFFSNTLAVRGDLSGDPTFAELLQRIRATTLGAQVHRELPFEKLVQELNPQRSQSHSPIFQVLFGYDIAPSRPPQLAGERLEQLPVPDWQWARFDLSIVVRELPDGSLRAQLEYSTDLFDPATIERLTGHYETLLQAAVEDCEMRLSRLPLLTAAERAATLGDWNATERPYERRCLHELVTEQARRAPQAIAVVTEDGRCSYGELEQRVNQLARELVDVSVQPGALVGICLERSVDLVVAMLAVLKAGAAYVPIDPSYPSHRQELMLADSHARVLITDSRLAGAVEPGETRVVYLDRERGRIECQPTEALDLAVDPQQRAYVIYTSGSTGRPKGVEVTHRSVANLICHMREQPGLDEHDVLANLTTPAFDLSVPDWYLPLSRGARLAIVPREATLDGVGLAGWLARWGVTFMQATPTTWQLLIDAGWTGSSGLKIVCGGDALSPALARQLHSRGDSVWHMYGPTETTVWSSILRLAPDDGPPLLGGPIANTRFYVLDANRQPVPIGVSGELFIGGEGVARGYHDRAELTADRFLADPFSVGEQARLYRTGDLVRWREGARLEFLGRIDQQVKLRGFRIELGEVQAVLESHPQVSAAVALVREDAPGDQRLVAYLVAAGDGASSESLRQHCRTQMPPFMTPQAFVYLDAFPLTANGKLDRGTLPAPDGSQSARSDSYVKPQTPVEHALASIWSEVLGVSRVGLDDDFFDLGGHSLLAVRMLARSKEDFGADVDLTEVFEHPTLRELAGAMTQELAGGADEDELVSLLAEIEAAG